MDKKVKVLNSVDGESVKKFKDMSIKHNIATKLEFNINIAGAEFNDLEEAIIFAYRCGLASASSEPSPVVKGGKGTVDQDELYKILKKGHSVEHKADFLREIAKEWFPIELHNEKKIKAVHLELIEMANFLEK